MIDHDDMKGGLLEELIQKLMEMKDGGAGGGMKDAGAMGMDADDSGDPKAKLAMLEIKKDDGDEPDADDMPGKPDMPEKPDMNAEPDEAFMKKPIDAQEMLAIKKKHLGL